MPLWARTPRASGGGAANSPLSMKRAVVVIGGLEMGVRSPGKQRLSAVDPEDLTIDELGSRARQIRDRIRNLGRLGVTDERLGRGIHHLRIDDPGRLESRRLGRAGAHG